MNYYLQGLQNYVGFGGRARRTAFWFYVLFNFIAACIWAAIVEGLLKMSPTSFVAELYALATLLPSLAFAVRRLHDTGRSGWWILIGLIPLIGWIILLVFYLQDSVPGTNKWGPNPKEGAAVAVATA